MRSETYSNFWFAAFFFMDLAQFPLRYKLFTKQLLNKSPGETWLKLYSTNVSIHISEVCGVLAICYINLNRI